MATFFSVKNSDPGLTAKKGNMPDTGHMGDLLFLSICKPLYEMNLFLLLDSYLDEMGIAAAVHQDFL